MTAAVWPSLLLLAAALAVWVPGSVLAGHRVRRLAAAGAPERRAGAAAGQGVHADPRRRWLLAGAAGLAVGLVVGGAIGACAACALTVGGERLLRSAAPDAAAVERAALRRELPAACELLAVCLAAGLPVAGALAAVGVAVPEPLGGQLRRVAGLHRMGADPRRAWVDAPASLDALGRALVRAGESGAAAVPALRALAAESRATTRAEAGEAVQRAGVWVLAPLGLCFLPAFVCLGVVPLVLGIAGNVLG
jgi:Flp pilus assembly protein TadB